MDRQLTPAKALRRFAAGTTALCLMTGMSCADIVQADDVIIQGSLCVGIDCVNGESFGFDTILMKENNLRVKFDDTSASGSFPSNDWQLTANDSVNGGLNKFSIEDTTAGRIPFTIEAGARTNALYVADNSKVGIGTSSAVIDLHIQTGNSPGVRLEQDGSSGFTAQTWDIASNEANFFVRDVTGGSLLPFKILPRSPSNSLVVATSGDVGVGTNNPTSSVHVRKSNGSAKITVEETSGTAAARGLFTAQNNGDVFMTLHNTALGATTVPGAAWNIQNQAGQLRMTTAPGGANEIEFQLDAAGNLNITGNLTTTGSVCGSGCDRVFDADYELPTIAEQTELMFAKRHLPNVGPTDENGPFNVTQKVAGMLNELEKAHIYISMLNERLDTQDRELAELKLLLQTKN